jgi:hypothetical protein
MDYEEQRGQVSKLKMLKKKLQDEITKHQAILQRYQKIREKLRYETPSPGIGDTDERTAPAKGLREKAQADPRIFKS